MHVCRRWRSVVFGSPRRLNLQLVCTTRTPTDALDVWPALPHVIVDYNCQTKCVDNLIALLERSQLVRRITQIELLDVHLEDISEAMEVLFLELTVLILHHSWDEMEPTLPLSDSFLGGSAPRLQYLELDGIPFPGLPKLLLSATHLTDLHLFNIPHSGYISPEAMVACLSMLTSLESLFLRFRSPQSRPDRESRRPPPLTRIVIPILTRIWFKGDSEYLEDLVARVDAPRLNSFEITFFNDIVFDTPQFTRLIRDTMTFKAFDKASVALGDAIASIKLSSKTSDNGKINVEILCRELAWQVSFLAQVCASSLSPHFVLEDLYISEHPYRLPVWEDNTDNALWVELLHPFTTVKNLFLFEKLVPRVVPALQDLVGGRGTEVLPTLQNVFIEGLQPSGHVREGIGNFVAARQLTSHPITVSRWDRYPNQPQVPHESDLSSGALRINPGELAQLGLPLPVALAPKLGYPAATSKFPPDFVAASAASTRPAEFDLSLLPEEGPTTAHTNLDPSLRSRADGPIKLDLEGMDIDMIDLDVSIFGDEPPDDIPTANLFDNTTTTGGSNPSPPLLEASHRETATDRDSQAFRTALPFDMTIDMDSSKSR